MDWIIWKIFRKNFSANFWDIRYFVQLGTVNSKDVAGRFFFEIGIGTDLNKSDRDRTGMSHCRLLSSYMSHYLRWNIIPTT